jgi:hypothetical protein
MPEMWVDGRRRRKATHNGKCSTIAEPKNLGSLHPRIVHVQIYVWFVTHVSTTIWLATVGLADWLEPSIGSVACKGLVCNLPSWTPDMEYATPQSPMYN